MASINYHTRQNRLDLRRRTHPQRADAVLLVGVGGPPATRCLRRQQAQHTEIAGLGKKVRPPRPRPLPLPPVALGGKGSGAAAGAPDSAFGVEEAIIDEGGMAASPAASAATAVSALAAAPDTEAAVGDKEAMAASPTASAEAAESAAEAVGDAAATSPGVTVPALGTGPLPASLSSPLSSSLELPLEEEEAGDRDGGGDVEGFARFAAGASALAAAVARSRRSKAPICASRPATFLRWM